MAKLWLEWDSTTTQQARNKANGENIWRQNLRKTKKNGSVEFSETVTKMRSISRRHCGWSGASTTTQKYETGEKTVLKCLFKWARHWVDELVLRWAACFIKNVGITNCRWQWKLYTSVKVGHSRTIVYLTVWYGFTYVQAKTTLEDDIHEQSMNKCTWTYNTVSRIQIPNAWSKTIQN